MGVCSSAVLDEQLGMPEAEHKAENKRIEDDLKADHGKEEKVNKLLLLGAGESGKSTLFKQMITLYGPGFSEEERKTYREIIFSNVITNIKTLCVQSDSPLFEGRIHSSLATSKKYIIDLKGDAKIDSKIGGHIKALWKDKGIRTTFDNRAKFQLTDNADWYFDRIEEISKENSYIPSEGDVLRARVRTTGIVENDFSIEGNKFKMFDVGGQRNERKKWIHCFENVTAVLFVAAISAYDQTLYEDETTNRMVEALNLFEEICNSRWFRDTSMVLFLNKSDLFAEKIKKVPLKYCFPEYTGENTYEATTAYLIHQFESRNRSPDKQVYTHITCATNTDNVSAVFNAVKDIIIRRSLNEAGLV